MEYSKISELLTGSLPDLVVADRSKKLGSEDRRRKLRLGKMSMARTSTAKSRASRRHIVGEYLDTENWKRREKNRI